jgi:hypothetical protein
MRLPSAAGGVFPLARLMIRESLADDAIHVSALVRGNRIRVYERTTTGGSTHELPGANNGAPEWLRIVRTGNTFDLYRSNSGTSWTLMQSHTVTMGTNVFMETAVTSNSSTTLATGAFCVGKRPFQLIINSTPREQCAKFESLGQ